MQKAAAAAGATAGATFVDRAIRAARPDAWRLVLVSFGTLAILIALFSMHMMQAAAERRSAEDWHVHALEVLVVAENFRSATFNILRGERGYLLTGNERFLQPYDEGRASSAALLARLRRLVADNPSQTRNAALVGERLASFAALSDRLIVLERTGRHDAALAIVRAGHGRREFERLQNSVNHLEQEERTLLIERRERLDASTRWNERLGYVAAALIVTLLLAAALATVAALRAQRRAAAVTEELRRLATVDELTGLPNRRQFTSRLDEETARAQRHGSPLCLAILDLDHFKAINDRYGHAAGDAVLRQLAAIMREKIRLGDSPARLGGEEFVLLLPNTRAHQAQLVCDRLRATVAAHIFAMPNGGGLRVTVSTGVAVLNEGEDGEALMRRSDEALYEAKARGRNQVRLAA